MPIGIGFELTLMCDLRVVEDTAMAGFLNRRFGIPILCTVCLPAMICILELWISYWQEGWSLQRKFIIGALRIERLTCGAGKNRDLCYVMWKLWEKLRRKHEYLYIFLHCLFSRFRHGCEFGEIFDKIPAEDPACRLYVSAFRYFFREKDGRGATIRER